MRCIRHALRTTPSPDWWKRVLLVAPCYRTTAQGLTPGAVFTSEMICEATIDRIFELLKLTNSGNYNFSVILHFFLPFSHDILYESWLLVDKKELNFLYSLAEEQVIVSFWVHMLLLMCAFTHFISSVSANTKR